MKKIEQTRKEIDRIDDELVRLFAERMKAAGEVASYKAEHGLPVLNSAREREILARVAKASGEGNELYVKLLFSTLFDVSKSYQTRLLGKPGEMTRRITEALKSTPQVFPDQAVVACQGIEGAYSQLACEKLFSLPSVMYFTRFDGVFSAVEKGLCRYGILPIENSSYGSVGEVYDLMKQYRFFIVRSVRLRIEHTLLARPGAKEEDIREIFSHPQAIGQCSEFLKRRPDIKVTVVENTAVAARRAAEDESGRSAAISSRSCAALYGLTVLSDKVQNSDNNYTRFICISKEHEIYPGASKISLMLTCPHEPGSLYRLLAKFAAAGLNVSKLESRPIPGKDFEFLFYFDLEASVYREEVLRVLDDLEQTLEYCTYLGSYTEG